VTAIVTFSVEVELGWGVVQSDKLNALSPERRAETDALERILELCDELDIPITFNVVGHLLRDKPLKSYDGGHEQGWFKNVPLKGSGNDPRFYAPGLVEKIVDSSVNHEVCTHTFTHVECGNVSPETLRWELDRVFETHEDFGLENPVSLVPPSHSPPPKNILEEYGINIIRMAEEHAPNKTKRSNKLELGRDILFGHQPNADPRLVNDIAETYCTRYPSLTTPFLQSGQIKPHPVFRSIPRTMRQRLHRYNMTRNLKNVITNHGALHIWTHLWETANMIQWSLVEKSLRQMAAARNKGKIRILTMRELNAELRQTLSH